MAPLNEWYNIKHLSQVPTHRVSDHCQHANQGQGADGERQGRQTICRGKDKKAIRDLTLASDRNINALFATRTTYQEPTFLNVLWWYFSQLFFSNSTLTADMFPAFKPYCSDCMNWGTPHLKFFLKLYLKCHCCTPVDNPTEKSLISKSRHCAVHAIHREQYCCVP